MSEEAPAKLVIKLAPAEATESPSPAIPTPDKAKRKRAPKKPAGEPAASRVKRGGAKRCVHSSKQSNLANLPYFPSNPQLAQLSPDRPRRTRACPHQPNNLPRFILPLNLPPSLHMDPIYPTCSSNTPALHRSVVGLAQSEVFQVSPGSRSRSNAGKVVSSTNSSNLESSAESVIRLVDPHSAYADYLRPAIVPPAELPPSSLPPAVAAIVQSAPSSTVATPNQLEAAVSILAMSHTVPPLDLPGAPEDQQTQDEAMRSVAPNEESRDIAV